MSKERQHWLDVVKGLAIILVVIGHVGSTYGGESASQSFNTIHAFIYSFHMPLFMFISEYLFISSLKNDYKITALRREIDSMGTSHQGQYEILCFDFGSRFATSYCRKGIKQNSFYPHALGIDWRCGNTLCWTADK